MSTVELPPITTDPAFIKNILDYPDDPTLPKVYADWLEERDFFDWDNVQQHVLNHPTNDGFRMLAAIWCDRRDQPKRAEFIRLQCDIAKFEGYTGNHHYQNQLDRSRKLLELGWYDWFPLKGHAHVLIFPEYTTVGYRRGHLEADEIIAEFTIARGWPYHAMILDSLFWTGQYPCSNCEWPYPGYVVVSGEDGNEKTTCPRCQGHAGIQGIGHPSVEKFPLLEVRLISTRPYRTHEGEFGWTCQTHRNPAEYDAMIPEDIFRLIEPHRTHWAWFATQKEAYQALSKALLQYAKAQEPPTTGSASRTAS